MSNIFSSHSLNSEFIKSSGGRHCKRPVKAFEVYDTETRSWTTLPMMPCKRSYGGVIWDTKERLCLLGGLRQGGHQSSKFTKNVNIFDSNQGMETYFPLWVLHRLSCFLFCSVDSVENMYISNSVLITESLNMCSTLQSSRMTVTGNVVLYQNN